MTSSYNKPDCPDRPKWFKSRAWSRY